LITPVQGLDERELLFLPWNCPDNVCLSHLGRLAEGYANPNKTLFPGLLKCSIAGRIMTDIRAFRADHKQ